MAGAGVTKSGGSFLYPSYVQDIMGCVGCIHTSSLSIYFFIVTSSHWGLDHLGMYDFHCFIVLLLLASDGCVHQQWPLILR